MAIVSVTSKLVNKLCEALGLKGRFIQKLVIEIGLKDTIKVYIQELMEQEQLEKVIEVFEENKGDVPLVVQSVKDVNVSDKGEVSIKPNNWTIQNLTM